MSTYFKIINLDKKQRGMLATHIADEQAQELIAQKYDAGYTKSEEQEEPYIGFSKSNIKGSWAKEHRGYLSYYSKEHAGAIFMEACGNLWGHKGEWYGDRVVIISDAPCDDQLWEESYDWPEQYFHIDYADTSWSAKDEIDEIDRKARVRKNASSK
ncbi:hypothetical protein [Variovorax sp. RA8]|uniref:hypothetical protein n=1 Tax=Variovorax sp. (strain JCM 16519 / RA8) TaxID=662548 RepID=UPI000A4D349F|nr:hypothetical protein [Variovorax sp. RA8]